MIFHGGYDSTLEEAYFCVASAALRRGFNVLAFDGPGQGTVLRDQGLTFRPDWEAVVTPVVDFALTQSEVDAQRIVLIGMSLGGYLAGRAAAFEHRIAATVLYDGVYDFHSFYDGPLRMAAKLDGGMDELVGQNVGVRWSIHNGEWTFGVDSADALIKASEAYTMDGIAQQVTCPTLVLAGEDDQFLLAEPKRIFDALSCQEELISFPEDEGGGEHCQEGAMAVWHQRAFDWIDTVLPA